jgi:hypothetical protein
VYTYLCSVDGSKMFPTWEARNAQQAFLTVYKIVYTAVDEKPEMQLMCLMSDPRHR